MTLKDKITADMIAAMKAKDAERTSTLRMIKTAITNREKDGGAEITDEDFLKLLRSQVKQRRDSVEQYEKGGRQDLADKEKAEIVIVEAYMPQAAAQEEIDEAVARAITETGASSMKEMGAVIDRKSTSLNSSHTDISRMP